MKNISIEGGLSMGYVSGVLQDKTGFLWIATRDGLNRYDGYNFEIHRREADNSSLASSNIRQIFEDDKGRLWMTFVQGGLDVFDKESGKFRHILPIENHAISTEPSAFSILGACGSGIVIVWNKNFYIVYEGQQHALRSSYTNQDKLSSANAQVRRLLPAKGTGHFLWGNIANIASFTAGRIWMLDLGSSLFELKVDSIKNEYNLVERVIPAALIPGGRAKTSLPFYAIDHQRKLVYFQQYGNVYRLSEKNDSIELFMLNTVIKSYGVNTADARGNIWLMHDGALYHIDVRERKAWYIESDDPELEKKKAKNCGNSFVDRTGNIWVCTLGYGLMKINLRNTSFHHLKREDHLNFSTKRISASINGHFFIVPWEGDDCFLDTAQMKLLPSPIQFKEDEILSKGKKVSIYPFLQGVNSIPASILNDGNYFLRTWNDNKLVLLEPDKKFVAVIYTEKKEALMGVFLLAKTHQVWFVAEKKFLCAINLKSGETIRANLPEEAGAAKETMAQDKDGNIWLATGNGVCMYNTTNGKWRMFKNNIGNGLLTGNILCFSFDASDYRFVWIGFEGLGLCKMDRTTGVCWYFMEENGLASDVVYGILQDKKGNLWMSGNKGISCFNPATSQFRKYTFEDGLQSNEFNRYCFGQSASGAMVFGGVNGINYFKTSDISTRREDINVWVTDMFVNNHYVATWVTEPYLNFSVFDKNVKIQLPHNLNVLLFRFASSDLTAPGQNKFSYKLEGIDKDWSLLTTGHEAVYTYLPPGDYVFRVRGTNRDGIWSKKEAGILFTITYPWWQTWWWKTVLVLVVLSIIYGLYRYRLNQLLRLQSVRNRISADMHDEIGSMLSSISFYSQALLMQSPGEKQRTVLEKIKDNAQYIQDGFSDIVWSIKADMDSFENLLIRMQWIGNELLEPKNILFHFEADEKLKHHKINMMTRKNVYLIFKEALHNAAKYAQCENVRVSIKTSKHKIIMMIKDDGKGFDTQKKRNGNGMGNMQQRAQTIGGRLTIYSNYGAGTELILIV